MVDAGLLAATSSMQARLMLGGCPLHFPCLLIHFDTRDYDFQINLLLIFLSLHCLVPRLLLMQLMH